MADAPAFLHQRMSYFATVRSEKSAVIWIIASESLSGCFPVFFFSFRQLHYNMFGPRFLLIYTLVFAKLLESLGLCLSPDLLSFQPLFLQTLFIFPSVIPFLKYLTFWYWSTTPWGSDHLLQMFSSVLQIVWLIMMYLQVLWISFFLSYLYCY